jgi:hypothetical protein
VLAALAVGLGLLAACVGLATWLVPAPDASDRLRDDAFYEFAWAANVAQGRGPVVSDGTSTSGVQLLWSTLLVPLAWFAGPASLPWLAPWLGVLLHALAAAGWWWTTRDRATGLVLALCWLGHPLLLRECQNGQETALAALCAAALWWGRRTGGTRWLLLGTLAVLARADLLALLSTLTWWRWTIARRDGATAPVVAAAGLALANVGLGGGLLPDSAGPMAWLWHHNRALVDPGFAAFVADSWWFARPALLGGPFALASAYGVGLSAFALLRSRWPSSLRVVPAACVGVACALGARDLATPGWAAFLLALLPSARRRPVPRALLAVLVGLGAIVVVHWALRWYPRDYYVAPLVVVAMVAVQRLGRLRWLLLLLPLGQLVDRGRVLPEPLAGQLELELAGRHLRAVLPPGERVGCFNSGLVTFHADVLATGNGDGERIGVVNLDGVVDARSFAALRQGRLEAWLDQQGVRFVVDNPVQFARDPRLPHACGHAFAPEFQAERDLVEIARFDVPGLDAGRPLGDSVRLYWRRGRGQPPDRLPSTDLGPWRTGQRVVAWAAEPGQVLECEAADGRRTVLASADVATTIVLPVVVAAAPCRLFVRGHEVPLLRLLPP